MPTPEQKKARAAYMRAYYHSHPDYAATVRKRTREHEKAIRATVDGLNRERARKREQFNRRRAAGKIKNPSSWALGAGRYRRTEQNRAYSAVQQALREGTLTRPGACIRCLSSCKPDAHHADYAKPLEVEWLCRSCHALTWRKS